MNIIVEHRVRLLAMEVETNTMSLGRGPAAVYMTIVHPGDRRLEQIIFALNRASFGCRKDLDENSISIEKGE